MKLNTVAIDLAKNSFYVVGFGANNKPLWRKKFNRQGFARFAAKHERSKVVMEACAGAHYWGRRFIDHGHEVELLPPQHVKAYLRGQKNDYNDAQAIGEASIHGVIRPVAVKTVEQQDEQAFHRIRQQLKSEQTALINQLRGLLNEYGIVIPKGIAQAQQAIPEILEDADNGLTTSFRELLHHQYQRYQSLREEVDWYDRRLQQRAREDEVLQRLLEVPGLGPVNGSQLKAWLGDGKQFGCGRDASAAVGLVPRQHSTGGRERLYGITKRGDASLRTAIIHGARAVVRRAKDKDDRLSRWVNQLVERRGFNRAVVALANKMVRIAWVVIRRQEEYRPMV